jgi:5-methyltetrahydrofolate--homocysteine methyltransferase
LFCSYLQPYKALGIAAVGGCCGTTPEYIRALAQSFANEQPQKRSVQRRSVVCSATQVVEIQPATVIGERINPTGKARFKEALRNDDVDYILSQAVEQAAAGAQILDVNVGLPEIDEAAWMCKAVKSVQSVTDLPLQLDSTRADVLAAGLRVYNGKPIVNSVNGEQSVLDAVLPLCKKYGAAVVGLTLDEKGIPEKAEQRFAIAQRIVDAAQQAGIGKEDVYIDCLTLTASAQQEAVRETLRAVQMVHEQLGVKTVLGVSNISFGLPMREQVNVSFLSLALAHGLDLPIMNPNAQAMMAAVRSFRVLYNLDPQAQDYIAAYAGHSPTAAAVSSQELSIEDAVLQGMKKPAALAAKQLLATKQPEEIVNHMLIPALDIVGDRFEKGTLFLPQLLQSAGAAQAAFDVIKEHIASTGTKGTSRGKIVIATVKGDIHDIGKNIVKVILENYGYEMIDLGRDVPAEAVVQAVRTHDVKLVGLSALMTTTLPSMAHTIALLAQECPHCKTMVGGAVLTPEYAAHIGADYYSKDAKQSVDIARKVLG